MSSELFAALAAPFDPAKVSWRVGAMTNDKSKGMALAYIDARDVMQRLDEVCGPGGWQNRHPPMHNGTICCEIGIKIDGEWVWKANGAGATGNVDNENEREMAEKGGYSDAFKRAAVLWGIGQYLYDVDSPWVELDDKKRIKSSEKAKLSAALTRNGAKQKSAYAARKENDFERITGLLRACVNLQDLQSLWKAEQKLIASWPDNWQEHITEEKDRIKSELMARVTA